MRIDRLIDAAVSLLFAFMSGFWLSTWLQGHDDVILYMSICMLVMAVNGAACLLEKE